GRRLYELAREGLTVDREPRDVTVHAIALLGVAIPDITLRVRCGKGTYVRTLAADLGAALGCGGALAALVRTRVGPYALEAAVPWTEMQSARRGDSLWARVSPVDSALTALSPLRLDAQQARRFAHGQAVTIETGAAGHVRVYGDDGALLGVGMVTGSQLNTERLLHADPLRPDVLH